MGTQSTWGKKRKRVQSFETNEVVWCNLLIHSLSIPLDICEVEFVTFEEKFIEILKNVKLDGPMNLRKNNILSYSVALKFKIPSATTIQPGTFKVKWRKRPKISDQEGDGESEGTGGDFSEEIVTEYRLPRILIEDS